MLRRIFGPKREEVTEDRENYTMRSFIFFAYYYYIVANRSRRIIWAEHVECVRG
jgi:hypothetical protein